MPVKKKSYNKKPKKIRDVKINLKDIPNQTYEICLEAIKHDYTQIQYVNDQTELICLKAIRINSEAIKYIRNPTDYIKKMTFIV